jgi:hypothetical protein
LVFHSRSQCLIGALTPFIPHAASFTGKVTVGDQGIKLCRYGHAWGVFGKHAVWVSCRDMERRKI